MKKPGSKCEKLFQIFDLLSEQRWTKSTDLAISLDVSKRTLFRYITDLMNAFPDFPVIESGQDGYRLVKSDLVRILKNQDDYLVLSAVHSTPLGQLLDNSTFSQGLLSRIYDRLEVRRAIHPEILRPLFDSLVKGYILNTTYAARNGNVNLTVSALRLAYQSNIPYLIVLGHHDKKIKTLGINKINKVIISAQKLATDELDRAMNLVNQAWGIMVSNHPITVTFQPDSDILQYFIDSPMHSSQVVDLDHNTPRITLNIHNSTEFIRYILRFGKHLRIIAPAHVIEDLHHFLENMQSFYSTPDSI